MSSPSLTMVPQWLKLAFGVKRALGVQQEAGLRGLSLASRCRGTNASALQEAEVPKRCPATILFSSMSRFSLLQINVDVEEPGTLENPTRLFEIHNIGSHNFWP
jgi:hypothetical protein